MVRKIDRLGRIVIPVEIRRKLKMNVGTPCEFRVNGDKLILSRSKICSVGGIKTLGDETQGICPYCKNELIERFNKVCCGNCGNKINWEKEQREDF